MNLSNKAWDMCHDIYDAILNHPFNNELLDGSLSDERFQYYIKQDVMYLHDFSKCNAMLAVKLSSNYADVFLKMAEYAIVTEKNMLSNYASVCNNKSSSHVTSAMLGYTSYLIRSCTMEDVAVGVAAVLPCSLVYNEVGKAMIQHVADNNKYKKLIQTYVDDDFQQALKEVIEIFNALASNVSEEIHNKMLEVFRISMCWEWHFLDEVYYMKNFDFPGNVKDNKR